MDTGPALEECPSSSPTGLCQRRAVGGAQRGRPPGPRSDAREPWADLKSPSFEMESFSARGWQGWRCRPDGARLPGAPASHPALTRRELTWLVCACSEKGPWGAWNHCAS